MLCRILIFLMLAAFAITANSKSSDFDMICGFFDELSHDPNIKKMSPEQKATFIDSRIARHLNTDSNAKAAWNGILSAVPYQRYELFKSAASSVLNNNWTCDAMHQLASTTGD